MTTSDWHVDESLWADYAAGRLDLVLESSIEAHVLRCEVCRASAMAVVPGPELAHAWSAISREVATPVPSRPLRWLRRTGLREPDSVLLGASDGLHLPWLVAVGGALACAIVTGLLPRYQETAFLLLAPLVPVLAVVAAYDATDPLRELLVATPYSKLRLALLRTSAALAVALPVTMSVGLLVPGLDHLAFAWLLPGLGLTTATLVLLTWLDAWSAALGVAAGWVTAVGLVDRGAGVAPLAGPAGQLTCAALAAVMAAVLVLRSTSLTLGGRS